MKNIYDLIIIGAGAAGLTAAIYAGRSGMKTLVFEEEDIGGIASKSYLIGNYPGFPEGIDGMDLMDRFYRQAVKAKVEFIFDSITKLWEKFGIKYVYSNGEIYKSFAIIIAAGGRPKKTEAINESKFIGKGISFCSICDGPETKGKPIVVIGTGDSAIDQTLYLADFTDDITIVSINSRGIFDCCDKEKMRLLSEKVKFVWNCSVYKFDGDNYLSKVSVVDNKLQSIIEIPCQYCFEFIGFKPNTRIFVDLIDIDDSGAIVTDEDMETNVLGIYAIGDVRSKSIKQLTTATADGTIAAYKAKEYVDNRRNKIE